MKNITIADILRGVTPGEMQSVGYMQMIPLISNLIDENIVSPNKGRVGTKGYGNMEFTNDSPKLMLVPVNAAYIVPQAAQDHAMAHAGFVKSRLNKVFETAACIQAGQGGYIPTDHHRLLVLPYALREGAHRQRKEKSYSKMWPAIAEFNGSYRIAPRGHLEDFLKQFEKELNQFVAEFEIVPNQVGAIVLINGSVVGIERAPSYEYWQDIWGPLVRECYGSLAIRAAKNGLPLSDLTRARVDLKDVTDFDSLENALKDAEDKEDKMVSKVVNKLLNEAFKLENESKEGEYLIQSAENAQLVGQIVTKGDAEAVVYGSLVTTKSWEKSKEWKEADAFKI